MRFSAYGSITYTDKSEKKIVIEECEKYRIQLARNNPSQYLQPLGMILLRMAGFCCQASDEFGARLYLMKARFIYDNNTEKTFDVKTKERNGILVAYIPTVLESPTNTTLSLFVLLSFLLSSFFTRMSMNF